MLLRLGRSLVGWYVPALVVGLAATTAAAGPVIVADFGDSIRTEQGGLFHSFGGRPDAVGDRLVTIGAPPSGAWRIDVAAEAAKTGVGAIVPLYDNRSGAGQPQGVDLSAMGSLHLRLAGELGKRRLGVELVVGSAADGDAAGKSLGFVEAADLDRQEWRTRSLALPDKNLDRKQVGAVRLVLEGEGPAWLAIDWMQFGEGEEAPAAPPASAKAPHPLRTPLWVWHTQELLADPGQIEEMLAFSKKQGLTDLFWQIPYKYEDGAVRLLLVDEQRRFNSAARKAGITVHALDGAPQFVLKANHPRMFKLLEALEEFNRGGPAEAAYRAIHLDNEPYVLKKEWSDPQARREVVQDYIELNRELGKRIKAAGMEFGVDIPFWWDLRGEAGRPEYVVRTEAGEVPLLEALFGCVQNVGIMSYRERVTGPNGVVGCCLTEFALGARTGVEVFAAIEMGVGERYEKGTTFGPYSPIYFAGQYETLLRALGQEKGCAGLAVHDYNHYRKMLERQP